MLQNHDLVPRSARDRSCTTIGCITHAGGPTFQQGICPLQPYDRRIRNLQDDMRHTSVQTHASSRVPPFIMSTLKRSPPLQCSIICSRHRDAYVYAAQESLQSEKASTAPHVVHRRPPHPSLRAVALCANLKIVSFENPLPQSRG